MTTGSTGAHFIGPTGGTTTGGGGFDGVHNDLDGRTVSNTHPASSISADTTGFVNSSSDDVQDVLADLDAAITDAPTRFKQIVHVDSDNSVTTVNVDVGDTLIFVDPSPDPFNPDARASVLIEGGEAGTTVEMVSIPGQYATPEESASPGAWSAAWALEADLPAWLQIPGFSVFGSDFDFTADPLELEFEVDGVTGQTMLFDTDYVDAGGFFGALTTKAGAIGLDFVSTGHNDPRFLTTRNVLFRTQSSGASSSVNLTDVPQQSTLWAEWNSPFDGTDGADAGTACGFNGGVKGMLEFGQGTHVFENFCQWEFRNIAVVKSDDDNGRWYFTKIVRRDGDIPYERESGGYMAANDIDVPDVGEMLDQIDLALNTLSGGSLGPNAGYSTDVGDGSSLTYTITHNLGTKDVVVSVRDENDFEVLVDNDAVDLNTVELTFEGDPPTTNQYRVTILADGEPAGGGGLDTTPRILASWSISGDLTTLTGDKWGRVPFNHTLTHLTAECDTAPTGADIEIDVNRRGSTSGTVMNTVATVLDGDTGTSHTDFDSTLDDGDADDAYTIDIDAVGSTDPGTSISIALWGVPR